MSPASWNVDEKEGSYVIGIYTSNFVPGIVESIAPSSIKYNH